MLIMAGPVLSGKAFRIIMKICRPLHGFIVRGKYFLNDILVIIKKWSLFSGMFCCILGEDGEGLLKLSILIYCGPGLFISKER